MDHGATNQAPPGQDKARRGGTAGPWTSLRGGRGLSRRDVVPDQLAHGAGVPGGGGHIQAVVAGIQNGGLGAGQFKSDSKTSPSKILLEAYADAYNKLVTAIRIYKTQTVKGGLGTGGTLKVQGSRTDSPKK